MQVESFSINLFGDGEFPFPSRFFNIPFIGETFGEGNGVTVEIHGVLVWNVLGTYLKEPGLEIGKAKVKIADGFNFKSFFGKGWLTCYLLFEISSICFLISETGDSGGILVAPASVIKFSVIFSNFRADQL